MFTIYWCLDLFLTGISLAISNADPSKRSELNGLASAISSVTSVAGPALWSSLYAASIEGTRPFPLDAHLTFYVMAALRLAVAYFAWNINPEHRERNDSDDDGERSHTGDERNLEVIEVTAC
ncbi:unnamed protein product [Ectocarpus sp. 8 AP-2014]